MGRYEAVVRAGVRFEDRAPGGPLVAPELPQTVIRFEHRDFVWHASPGVDPERGLRCPVLTVMVENDSDYDAERLATLRLLSAFAFHYQRSMILVHGDGGLASRPGPLDIPTFFSGGGDPDVRGVAAPGEVVVLDDARLRLMLALCREALSAESPFYRFLAFWNALDAAFDNDEAAMGDFIRDSPARAPGRFHGAEEPPQGWVRYFRDSNRNAIAHAVRRTEGQPVRDPDETRDRRRLARDALLLQEMVRDQVELRWGRYAVSTGPLSSEP